MKIDVRQDLNFTRFLWINSWLDTEYSSHLGFLWSDSFLMWNIISGYIFIFVSSRKHDSIQICMIQLMITAFLQESSFRFHALIKWPSPLFAVYDKLVDSGVWERPFIYDAGDNFPHHFAFLMPYMYTFLACTSWLSRMCTNRTLNQLIHPTICLCLFVCLYIHVSISVSV